MSVTNAISPASQDARVTFEAGGKPEDWADEINNALVLIRDDIQTLSSKLAVGTTLVFQSGNYKAVMPAAGVVRVQAISDTATVGSNGANYLRLTFTKNGQAVATAPVFESKNTEVPAYGGGVYLGQATVGYLDVVSLTVTLIAGPTPLSTANFSLFCTLTGT